LMKFSLPFTLELVGVLSFSMGIPFPPTSKLLQPSQLLKAMIYEGNTSCGKFIGRVGDIDGNTLASSGTMFASPPKIFLQETTPSSSNKLLSMQ
jgi:hypothetical protein